jgi:hypothetical protein
MKVNVWLFYKAGEDRTYARTTPPPEWQMGQFKNDGFRVFRAEVDLPVDEQSEPVQARLLTCTGEFGDA